MSPLALVQSLEPRVLLSNDTVTISTSISSASEAGPAGLPNFGAFVISRTPGNIMEPPEPLTISFQISGTAGNGTDYTATVVSGYSMWPPNLEGGTSLSGTIQFDANEFSKTIFIFPTSDSETEPEETVTLTIQDSAPSYTSFPWNNTATVTIASSVGGPGGATVSVAPLDERATEPVPGAAPPPGFIPGMPGANGSDTASFRFTRTGDLTQSLTVDFTFEGTATSGSDYTGLAGAPLPTSVTFQAGESEAILALEPVADGETEPLETVLIKITTDGRPYTCMPGQNQATVTIGDHINEAPVAAADNARAIINSPVTFTVTANDSDLESDDFTVQIHTQPAHGTAEVQGERITYTPNEGFTGVDTFTYTLTDEHGAVSQPVTVTMSVIDPVFIRDTTLFTLYGSPGDVLPSSVFAPENLPFGLTRLNECDGATAMGPGGGFGQDPDVAAALQEIEAARAQALATWTTAENAAWSSLESARSAASGPLAQALQAALNTSDIAVADATIAQADKILADVDGGGGLLASLNLAVGNFNSSVGSILSTGSTVQATAVSLDAGNLSGLRTAMVAASLQLEREITRIDRAFADAVTQAEDQYTATVEPAVERYAKQALVAYGKYLLAVTSAYVTQKIRAVTAERAYTAAAADLKRQWVNAVRPALAAYKAAVLPARDAFTEASEEALERARDAIRCAYGTANQVEQDFIDGVINDPQEVSDARQELRSAITAAKQECLSEVADAAREFVSAENPALKSLLGAVDGANRTFATDTAEKAQQFLDELVDTQRAYLSSINSAGAARDSKLNTDLTALLGTITTADGVYNRAVARAGKAHDRAVLGAASAHDAAVLSALDQFLSVAPAGSGVPAISATSAVALRTVVTKVRGLVGSTSTLLNRTVSLGGSFIVNTVNHGTEFSRAVNNANSAFYGSVIAAETTALDLAFGIRADYEKAINAADHAYIGGVTQGGTDPSIADALSEAANNQKNAAIDDSSSEDFDSLQHDPMFMGEHAGPATLDSYKLDVSGLINAIDGWLAAHENDPPAIAETPIDLGLPTTRPDWMDAFDDAFGDLTSGGGSGSPSIPDWLSSLDGLVTAGDGELGQNPADAPDPDESVVDDPGAADPPPAPLPEVTVTAWTLLQQPLSGSYIAGLDTSGSKAYRAVDGYVYEAAIADIPLITSPASNPSQWLVLEWDQWFVANGRQVSLTNESIDALATKIAQEIILPLQAAGNVQANSIALSTADIQKLRLEAIRNQQPTSLNSLATVSYADLVACIQALFPTQDSANAFIQTYGFPDMWRLYQMVNEGGWKVIIANHGDYTWDDGGSGSTTPPPPEYCLWYSPWRYKVPQLPSDAREIKVHDRIIYDGVRLGVPPFAEPSEIALRVHEAIHAYGINIQGSAGVYSAAQDAWEAFCAHPNATGVGRMAVGSLQILLAYLEVTGSGGVLSASAGYDGVRGLDEITGGLMAIINQDANARSLMQMMGDGITGSQEATDKWLFRMDMTVGTLSLGRVLKNAVTGTKTAANGVKTAAEARRATGEIAGETAQSARSVIDRGSGGLAQSRPSTRGIDRSPLPLPEDVDSKIKKLYPGDPLPTRVQELEKFVAGCDPRTGEIWVNGAVWDACDDAQKSRLFFEELKHQQRTFATPKPLRVWREALVGEKTLSDTYKFWEEFLAGRYAMGGDTAYGLRYAWNYDTISHSRIALEIVGPGIIGFIVTRAIINGGQN